MNQTGSHVGGECRDPKDGEAGAHDSVEGAEEVEARVHEGEKMRQEALRDHLVSAVVLAPPVAQRVEETRHLATLGFPGASRDS